MLALSEQTLQKDCLTAPKPSSPPKYMSTKDKQHNLINTYHKKFQDRRQTNELYTPVGDSSEEFIDFISEFENIMVEDSDDSSVQLVPPNPSIINKVFIEAFHTVYNVHVYNINTQALFHTGASINAISFKFYSSIQQMVKLLPTNRKVVSADGNSLGSAGEVHLKFKVGKIDFDEVFVILNNLQRDIILSLPWQCKYRIGCTWIERVSISLPLKTNF